MGIENSGSASCVQISSTTLLVAVPDGRSWLTDIGTLSVVALPVSAVASERSSVPASLVEGAIAAGLNEAEHTRPAVSYTLSRYIRWLAGNYAFAGQTPGLFRRGAERLELLARPDLAGFARQKADEEQGHANLAYKDLQGLGLPVAEIIQLVQPPSAEVFADRFRTYVESDDPVALFGFSYCLERMAVYRDEAFVRNVEAICPPKVRAFRFLKVHSKIGADLAHVNEQLSLFESLTAMELGKVVCATYETAKLLAQQPSIDHVLTDEETQRRLIEHGVAFSSPISEPAGTA